LTVKQTDTTLDRGAISTPIPPSATVGSVSLGCLSFGSHLTASVGYQLVIPLQTVWQTKAASASE